VEHKFSIVDVSDTSCRIVTKFCTVRGLANGNLFPEFGELWLWSPLLPCGDMHQSITDALVEIFGEIGRFLQYRFKTTHFSLVNLWRYWTKVHHICTLCREIIDAIKLLIHITIFHISNQFLNARVLNESQFANFAQNWLPWQRPLRYWKKKSRSIICTQSTFIPWKVCECNLRMVIPNRSGCWPNIFARSYPVDGFCVKRINPCPRHFTVTMVGLSQTETTSISQIVGVGWLTRVVGLNPVQDLVWTICGHNQNGPFSDAFSALGGF